MTEDINLCEKCRHPDCDWDCEELAWYATVEEWDGDTEIQVMPLDDLPSHLAARDVEQVRRVKVHSMTKGRARKIPEGQP